MGASRRNSGYPGFGPVPAEIARILPAFLAFLCLAAVVLAFVLPALSAVGAAVWPDGGSPSAAADQGGISGGRITAALRFTAAEALLSALAATAIGLPGAFLCARRKFPGRRFLLALSGVPLCVPPVIIALAFVLFYGRQGYLNAFLMRITGSAEPPVTFLYSLAGVVIAHGFYNFPVVLRTVCQVWERLPEDEEEAALLLGAGRFRVFRTITLPRLSGAILSSAVLVFLYCFFSFVIVLLFGGIGGTTVEVELYQAARSAFNYRLAGRIALVETLAALGIVFAYARLQKRLSEGTAGLKPGRPRNTPRGIMERLGVFAYLAFILVFFIGPLLSVCIRSVIVPSRAAYSLSGGFTPGLAPWRSLLGRAGFFRALFTTVSCALVASAVATLAALALALAAETDLAGRARPPRSRMAGRFSAFAFRVLPLAPLAVSSVMLGFGWTRLVPRGNWAVLVLAQAAMAWPFAWTQIRTALDRIPTGIRDAGMLLSSGRLDYPFRVLLPLAKRGILSGAGFVFAISAGDATLPLVLSLGRFENLSLMLYRLVGAYRFSEACACAVVLAVLCGLVFFFQESGNE